MICDYCQSAVSGTRCGNCGAPARGQSLAQPSPLRNAVGGPAELSVMTFDGHTHRWRPVQDRNAFRCECGDTKTAMQMRDMLGGVLGARMWQETK